MNKISKRNYYIALVNFATTGELSFADNDEVVTIDMESLKAFAANEIQLLDKKSAKAKERAAAKKAEGDELLELVRDALSDEFEPISEIAARVTAEDASAAKVQYRLNRLVEEGFAEKTDLKIKGGDGKKSRSIKGYKRI